jgi:3D-(3,5/4)-trihydroxycyclohexane-1,2-dione acylhydrolase (decyclizing)
MVGDGSYMMANSELATAVMMGVPFTVVLTDNRGYGCINRLQQATGGAPFNNLLRDSYHVNEPNLDFRGPCAVDGGECGQGRRHHRAGGRDAAAKPQRSPRSS